MQYTVVHSKDPYLLARLATDLQMDVCKYRDNDWNPFDKDMKYLHVESDSTFSFQSHNWCPYTLNKDRHELTSRNYIKVLTQILEP